MSLRRRKSMTIRHLFFLSGPGFFWTIQTSELYGESESSIYSFAFWFGSIIITWRVSVSLWIFTPFFIIKPPFLDLLFFPLWLLLPPFEELFPFLFLLLSVGLSSDDSGLARLGQFCEMCPFFPHVKQHLSLRLLSMLLTDFDFFASVLELSFSICLKKHHVCGHWKHIFPVLTQLW